MWPHAILEFRDELTSFPAPALIVYCQRPRRVAGTGPSPSASLILILGPIPSASLSFCPSPSRKVDSSYPERSCSRNTIYRDSTANVRTPYCLSPSLSVSRYLYLVETRVRLGFNLKRLLAGTKDLGTQVTTSQPSPLAAYMKTRPRTTGQIPYRQFSRVQILPRTH